MLRNAQRWSDNRLVAILLAISLQSAAGAVVTNNNELSHASKIRAWRQWPDVNPFAQNHPGACANHAVAAGQDGSLWVFGGRAPGDTQNDLYKLDPDQRHWARISPTGPAPRGTIGHAMVAIDMQICLFGGFPDMSDPAAAAQGLLAKLWCFSPASMKWNLHDPGGAPAPAGRMHHAMSAVGTDLFLYGGTLNFGEFAILHATKTEYTTIIKGRTYVCSRHSFQCMHMSVMRVMTLILCCCPSCFSVESTRRVFWRNLAILHDHATMALQPSD